MGPDVEKYCICADPENCKEPVNLPRRCKAGLYQKPVISDEYSDDNWVAISQACTEMARKIGNR